MFDWIVFNVCFPIILIFLSTFAFWISNKDINIITILGGGQLWYYCITQSALTIKDMVETKEVLTEISGEYLSIILGGLILCMVISTFASGTIALNSDKDAKENWRVAISSILTTIMTIIIVGTTRNTFGLL